MTKKKKSLTTPQTFPSPGGVVEDRGGQDTPDSPKNIFRDTRNYMSLPYNPKLRRRARELRKAGNLAEVLFWNQVKNKQFKSFDFDRQKVIGNYIVDFYCTNCNVVIEVDGSSHDEKQEYDAVRDAFLESLGLTVIHISVDEEKENMGIVMQMLHDHSAFDIRRMPPSGGGECS